MDIQPIDLAPELAQKSRVDDLLSMRKREGKHQYPVKRYEIKDILVELNERIRQYKSQSSYSFDFKVLQTVQDYQFMIVPLQIFKPKQRMLERLSKAKVDYSKPVAMFEKKLIYIIQDGEFTFLNPNK